MPMLENPSLKYRQYEPVPLVDKQWPYQSLKAPPRWLSTDLRDGSQALVKPFNVDQKVAFFKLLVAIGFKEIEIGFLAASSTEYDFTRHLVDHPNEVPDDTWIQVMCPCRDDAIHRTVQAAQGAKKVIVHLYIATSAQFRQIVYNKSEDELIAMVVRSTKLLRSLTKDAAAPLANGHSTEWNLQLGLEDFRRSPMEFVIRACDAVQEGTNTIYLHRAHFVNDGRWMGHLSSQLQDMKNREPLSLVVLAHFCVFLHMARVN